MKNVDAAAGRLALALASRERLHRLESLSNASGIKFISLRKNINNANSEIKAAQKNLKNAWARLGVNSSKFPSVNYYR
jgi:hypothetical protein